MGAYEQIFPQDKISKRERVELTLSCESVDRAALHEQLSYNPRVISEYTGKHFDGYTYGIAEIGVVVQNTLDMSFPIRDPLGTGETTDEDGFVYRLDNWTRWRAGRPFSDTAGAASWLEKVIGRKETALREFSPDHAADNYRRDFNAIQMHIGETVLCGFSKTDFDFVFDSMGLELYSYFSADHPDFIERFMELSTELEIRRVAAVADRKLSPVILIPEDFATKQGPIFSPGFLERFHFPYVKRLTRAWHDHGYKVLYHSDGNYKKSIPPLIECGVDGFYCLEPNCCMDVVELKTTWPQIVWAGGVDGVDLMERGSPGQVREEVRRHIRETDALANGGMFVATSSEISPTIPPENFRAMVDAAGEFRNSQF